MDNLEKIKNKILKQAEKQSKEIWDIADKEIKSIQKKNKEELDKIKKAGDKEIKNAVKVFKDKTLAQARLKAKSEFLEKREEMMQSIITDAVKSLEKRPKEYQDFIKNSIKKLDLGKITIYGNKEDKELIKKADSSITFKETDILGIIVEDNKQRKIDLTIPTLLNIKINEIRQKINK